MSKNPHVVLLQRPADEIYDSLIKRRIKMKQELQHQRPNFGIWDIGVIVSKELIEYSREEAIKNIQLLLEERKECYNKYATLKINSADIFKEKLPKSLLDII